MLRLLIDTSVWLDMATRREGQKWIVPLRVLKFQGKLELLVPALIIESSTATGRGRSRPLRQASLTGFASCAGSCASTRVTSTSTSGSRKPRSKSARQRDDAAELPGDR